MDNQAGWLLQESVEESLVGGTCLSITRWLHGGIWWDPFQFLFSRQTGFYNDNFSPQEEVLAWKRTNETYLFDTNPTNLKTAATPWDSREACNQSLPSLHHFLHSSSLLVS
jgi:hypothetical protein